MTEPQGDILVFLTGEEEIHSAEKMLKDKILQIEEPSKKNLNVRTLFAALPAEMQLQAFVKVLLKSRSLNATKERLF